MVEKKKKLMPKKDPVKKKVVKAKPLKKKVVKIKPVKKTIIKKNVRKPKKIASKRVQTYEGWKRSKIRQKKEETEKKLKKVKRK